MIPGGVAVGTPQSFPPTGTKPLSWPRDFAVSADGKTLLAALNLADRAAIVDLKTKAVKYVTVGSYPYGAAITRKGKGLVSNESDGTVSVIDLASGTKEKDIAVGAHLSHPEAIAIDPKGERAYVAVASEDRIAVIDTAKMVVERKLSVQRSQGVGTQPVNVSVTKDGCRLLASDSGEDAIAVFALKAGCDTKRPKPATKHKKPKKHKHRRHSGQRSPNFTGKVQAARAAKAKPFQLIGRVPTASYPVFAGATPKRENLVWVAAKGLGTGANPNGPNPLSPNDTDNAINSFQYLPSIVTGLAGTARFPTDKELSGLSKRANAQVKPLNVEAPPAGTPLAPNGPIKHVFYIVRENRTYDQILGDDPRGDGDPNLAVFGHDLTPNAHLLAQRFPLLDHVYANSEASIDGHFWTSAGAVSDYVVKNWHQNYAGRRPPVRLRRLRGHLAGQAVPVRRRRGAGHPVLQLRRGDRRHGAVPGQGPHSAGEPAGGHEVLALGPRRGAASPCSACTVPSTNCYPNDASIGKDAITQQEVFDSTAPGARPAPSRARVLPPEVHPAAGHEHGAGVQLPGAHERPHERPVSRPAHAAGDGGRQRLRARPDRRHDLALERLEQLADPRDGGRLAGRRRPHRRPPDPGVRDQPVREARRRGAHALRLPVADPHARAADRDEAVHAVRRAGDAPVRRVRLDPEQLASRTTPRRRTSTSPRRTRTRPPTARPCAATT